MRCCAKWRGACKAVCGKATRWRAWAATNSRSWRRIWQQPEDAELVAATILSTFTLPFELASHQTTLTASLGISMFPEHGEDPLTLLRNADMAMYSAKRAGGGTFRMFRSALSDSMQRRVLLERELKTALERNELHLEYQPLLDRNGSLDGVEALLRWNNPEAGQVSPAEFIPIAEETGLIPSIGEWVTQTACRNAARWLQLGYDVPRIAVNVSALQFADGKFPALVERILQECGLPASRLELEITETALMDNLDGVIEQIELLRQLGVRFAIDDFGTGYSSLSHLRNLPVDCVKIDRSFIKDLEPGAEGCTTLVRGIIALAHNLGLQVVAEGVETAQQLALLNTLGCDINQGFFLHRPMSDRGARRTAASKASAHASLAKDIPESELTHSPGVPLRLTLAWDLLWMHGPVRVSDHWVEISLKQIAENFRAVRQVVGPDVEVMPVVKADAYRHGAVEVSRALAAAGARWLAVSNVEEGAILRDRGITTRILVMADFLPAERAGLLEYNLTPVIHSLPDIAEWDRLSAESGGEPRDYHLKIDSGMGRLGTRASPRRSWKPSAQPSTRGWKA